MTDWYTEALAPMWRNGTWVAAYAAYTGHFVDDFGTMIRVYQYFGDDTFVVESD